MAVLKRRAYSSDLTDIEWRRIRPLIPAALPGGRPRNCNMREILNAIFYRLKNGCIWQDLPHDFPPHQTVYEYFRVWTLDGSWQRIHDVLHGQVRHLYGKKSKPSVGIIDSQSVKTDKKGEFVAMMLENGLKVENGTLLLIR
jgi:putative transposase